MTAIGSYNIAWGDTLSQIAARAGSTVQALQALNPEITNPDLIYAGDSLRLSADGGAGATGDAPGSLAAIHAPRSRSACGRSSRSSAARISLR